MADLITYFTHINKFNWGDGPYQWLFYAGILLTLIFEKNKIARIVFGWLPIAFLVAIYNPVFNHLIRIVFPNPDAYYVRMFSFIPVTYGIGVGLMQIVKKMRGCIKALCILTITIFVVMTSTNVYQALGMESSANIEKVPDGLIEIINAVHNNEQENICIAVPYPLSTSIRQVDASVTTPYGRDDGLRDVLHRELSQAVPSVNTVMNEAGKRAVDFIVVARSEECRNAFQEQGYEPFAETNKYMIYAVENVPRLQRKLDNQNRIISQTNVDKEGRIQKTERGYTTILYEYNDYGYRIKETYLDENGQEYVLPAGYVSVKKKYRFPSGLLESMVYLNRQDEPVLVNGCYEIRNSYDANKRLNQESFYDQYGNLMIRTDLLYAARKLEYGKNGRLTRESFYGIDDKLVLCSDGYAAYTREFDNKNRIVAINYFDVNGRHIKTGSGYARIERQYDEADNLINEIYIDEQGNKVNQNTGYAEFRREYDSYNNEICESYWDEHGSPTIYEGYHSIEKDYDAMGNVIEERTYDQNGELVHRDAGYAIVRRTWNDQKQMLTEKYFDKDGNPTNNVNGVASIERIYENMSMVEEIRRDANGEII